MGLWENLYNAFAIIILNKLRAGLSMLGIIIGVASVIIMLTIGEGAQKSIVSRVQALGTNLITISPGAQKQSDVRTAAAGAGGSAKALETAHADGIRERVSGLTAVAPELSGRKQVIRSKQNTNTKISGVTPDYAEVRNFHVQTGRYITPEDLATTAKVAVLGVSVYQSLFPNGESPLGEDLVIGNFIFTVVGIMEEKGSSGFSNTDDVIFIPLTTAQRVVFGNEYLSTISIAVANSDAMTAAKDGIQNTLLAMKGLKSIDDADFTIQNQADALSTVSEITGTLKIFLGGVAAISLLVGGIGVMNIMLVSVTERTREIGLRKALGATRWAILSQFLTESVVLSSIGGALGIGISIAVIAAVKLSGVFDVSASSTSILLSSGFSLAVGVVFGILPAYKAGNLKPIDALRFE